MMSATFQIIGTIKKINYITKKDTIAVITVVSSRDNSEDFLPIIVFQSHLHLLTNAKPGDTIMLSGNIRNNKESAERHYTALVATDILVSTKKDKAIETDNNFVFATGIANVTL